MTFIDLKSQLGFLVDGGPSFPSNLRQEIVGGIAALPEALYVTILPISSQSAGGMGIICDGKRIPLLYEKKCKIAHVTATLFSLGPFFRARYTKLNNGECIVDHQESEYN
ncbi:hypothetical protein FUT69_08520 [Xylella taiwanensis]|uniref:Uncharacterized protein n=1 Tax=Xylella taiwanensis TaxID=1444770 RepID=A0ABS8TY69_9GAMM|nr:hypothetical protein [Xylella taiwanensis]MCD8456507.1 hypothetical protein [Xylella taiwanensis]MCD8458914.1 hypothetical protein [Xylella taiwanensis]MCD8461052.1 hypothetical protein [Xylella taiwanensis]MCD8462888.1 hypothetical protein [Xylella taiwanensis]MCD8465557.1 hypothetical protein [Xylella taiwanensis]